MPSPEPNKPADDQPIPTGGTVEAGAHNGGTDAAAAVVLIDPAQCSAPQTETMPAQDYKTKSDNSSRRRRRKGKKVNATSAKELSMASSAAAPGTGQEASMKPEVTSTQQETSTCTSSQAPNRSCVVVEPQGTFDTSPLQAEDAKEAGPQACPPEASASVPVVVTAQPAEKKAAPSAPHSCLRVSTAANPKSARDTLTAVNDPLLTVRADVVTTTVTLGQTLAARSQGMRSLETKFFAL
ncbi:uncharacterized protein LOC144134682 [Amblyomma americanum]